MILIRRIAQFGYTEGKKNGRATGQADGWFRGPTSNDHATTLMVGHWAFILALTGISVANGEFLEYDPNGAVPKHIHWQS